MMAAGYRQWNHLEDVKAKHTEGVEGQVEHIQSMKNLVEKLKAISRHILIISDTNINMSEDNAKQALSHICKTLLIDKEVMEDHGIKIRTKDKMKYDHIPSNLVTSIDIMQPIPDHCHIMEKSLSFQDIFTKWVDIFA